MAMMLVSPEDFTKELDIKSEIKREIKIVDINRGRTIGRTEVSNELRKEIAEVALTSDLTGVEIAKEFNVSTASVSAYKNGSTSTSSYNRPDEGLNKFVNNIKTEISDNARSRLLMALNEITPDKIKDTKLRDVASIARDMSVVAKNMEPNANVNINNQVVVYRPKLRNEDEYDVITVNE